MSRHLAMAAFDRLNNCEAFIDAASISVVSRDLRELASANKETEEKNFVERMDLLCQAYTGSNSLREKPFAYANGVAVIPVHGTLLNRFNWSYGYVTGYNFIRWQINAALDDEDVKTIVLDVNSPGGEAAGCLELAAEIAIARETKPILAVVDSLSASAAYAISSGATKIFLTPSGKAGSIGVIAMHVDNSKWLDEAGLKVTLIYAGAHKVDGNPFEALPEAVKADIQASVDKAYSQFVELVAANRSLDSQSIRDTEARVYRADDALEVKLVDAVKTPSEAVAAFLGEIGDDDPADIEDEDMTTAAATAAAAALAAAAPATAAPAAAAPVAQIDQAALSAAVADALTADRARSAGIRNSEEAKGREALATHLADSGMSVEQAKGILAAAPKQAATAATPANPLAAAMAATPQPEVGAEGAASAGEQADEVAAILGDQASATGRKPLKI